MSDKGSENQGHDGQVCARSRLPVPCPTAGPASDSGANAAECGPTLGPADSYVDGDVALFLVSVWGPTSEAAALLDAARPCSPVAQEPRAARLTSVARLRAQTESGRPSAWTAARALPQGFPAVAPPPRPGLPITPSKWAASVGDPQAGTRSDGLSGYWTRPRVYRLT